MINASQIAIIGTGLLGASTGLALKAAGYAGRVVGIGRRLDTARRAVAVGACDAAAVDFAVVADCQLAVIAVPLSGFDAVFQQLAAHDHDALVITDVGSTKLDVVEKANRYLPAPARFIGAHPMAGSERTGPDAATADLFQHKPCIICKDERSDPDAAEQVEALWRAVGCQLLHMDPLEHDRATAVTSHLPHAVASLLVLVAEQLGGFEVASTGFTGATRLASGGPDMRADLMHANAPRLADALAALSGQIDAMRDALTSGDHARLLNMLNDAKQRRDAWLSQREQNA